MGFIAIYITHATDRTAKKVANYLLDQKLVACANIFPIESAYWWNAAVRHDKEWVSLVKTTSELWEKVKSKVIEIHPYEVPCIVKYEVEANEAYEQWIRDSVEKA